MQTRREVNREAARTGVRGCVVPNCTPEAVDRQLAPLLDDTPARRAQLEGYDVIRRRLHTDTPAAETVARLLAE